MRGTFTGKDWAKNSVSNIFIDEELAAWDKLGSRTYPSVVINNKTYRGQIEPLGVYNAICAGFKNPPEVCLKTLGIEPKLSLEDILAAKSGIAIKRSEIVVLCLVIIVLNVVVVYMCRRRARRDMQNEMNNQIESAVSQYYALTQKSSRSDSDGAI